MSKTPHELVEEFPEYAPKIRDLKQSNAHFEALLRDYEEVNREIHKAETDVVPTDDMRVVEMRKKRLALKDELFQMLEGEI